MIKEINIYENKFSKIKESWKYVKVNKFYYNTITNEYFGENTSCRFYFNLMGKVHKVDGPAQFYFSNNQRFNNFFYINDILYRPYEFAFKTMHLICNSCQDFCNQKCF